MRATWRVVPFVTCSVFVGCSFIAAYELRELDAWSTPPIELTDYRPLHRVPPNDTAMNFMVSQGDGDEDEAGLAERVADLQGRLALHMVKVKLLSDGSGELERQLVIREYGTKAAMRAAVVAAEQAAKCLEEKSRGEGMVTLRSGNSEDTN